MFTNFFQKEDPALEEAIAGCLIDLKGFTSETDEYAASVKQLTELYALKPKTVSPDTLVTVAGNILIGVLVLKFEGTGIVTTKVWNFLQKTR